jgi:glutaredoxin
MRITLLGADWCPYTQKTKELLENTREKLSFEFEYVEISTPKGRELALKNGVISVPVLLLGGEVIFSKGVPSEDDLKEILELRK